MDFERVVAETPGLLGRLRQIRRHPQAILPVLTAKIKLTWRCNLSCEFCELPGGGDTLETATVLRVIDQLVERGLRKVHLSGGEVLLHEGLFEVITHAVAGGVQVNLTTNGTRLTRSVAKQLRRSGVHSVSLSLDAGDAELHDRLRNRKGAFEKTSAAIAHLAAFGGRKPKVRVNTVVGPKNFHTLDALHRHLEAISDAIFWRLIPVDTMRKGQRLTEAMVEQLSAQMGAWSLLEDQWLSLSLRKTHKFRKGEYSGGYYDTHLCFMPWLHLFIDPAGYVYPCCMTRGQISALGNIREQPLDAILPGAQMQNLKMGFVSHVQQKLGPPLEVCRKCDDFLKENSSIHRLLEEGA